MLDIVDGLLSGRASLLQAWVEGTLALASRHPLLLKFLQDDGTFTEQTEIAAAAAPTSARVSPEKESVGEQFIAEYQCLRRCQIRADAAMDSEKVGVLDMGATVVVFEEKKLESGVHRVRFDQGWCSLATADGTTVLARRSSSSTPTVGKGDSESGPLTNPDSNDTSSAVNNEEAKHVATGEEQPATTGAANHLRGTMLVQLCFVSRFVPVPLVIAYAAVAIRAHRWVAGIVATIFSVAVFDYRGQS
jgi:hypothetical protein